MKTLLLFLFAFRLFAGQTVPANGIEIWHETFGDKKDPALLLLMGGCCQGIVWPEEFCHKLADAGFYVIRYDHRDTGLSTYIDFEKNPYDLMDLAKDAAGLLDALGIEKAHLFGLSMGSFIAELMAVHYPERVLTLSLYGGSPDMRPGSYNFDGVPFEGSRYSKPTDEYLSWMAEFSKKKPPETDEERLEQRLEGFRILGGAVPFDEEIQREIHSQFLKRQRDLTAIFNHLLALKKSFNLILEAPAQIHVPTLIFQGTHDAIFQPDHGEGLAAAIADSKYLLLDGAGHVLNSRFYDQIVEEIKTLATESPNAAN